MYTISLAHVTDLESVLQLNRDLFAFETQFTTSYNPEWTTSERGVAYFKKRIEAQTVLVARLDDTICGYLCFHIDHFPFRAENPVSELENMYVVDVHRHKGVGTTLIERWMKIASERGVKRLKVGVLSSNAKALEFYRKSHFQMHEYILELPLAGREQSKE